MSSGHSHSGHTLSVGPREQQGLKISFDHVQPRPKSTGKLQDPLALMWEEKEGGLVENRACLLPQGQAETGDQRRELKDGRGAALGTGRK